MYNTIKYSLLDKANSDKVDCTFAEIHCYDWVLVTYNIIILKR